MDKSEARRRAVQLAQQHRENGDFLSWFEQLYASAQHDPNAIPWADLTPNAQLVEWIEENNLQGEGKTAVVIGCGLGDDAELLAENGFDVTAFDISASAIDWCKGRFPDSRVNYIVADLFTLPPGWVFDFVLEIYTIQALPLEFRDRAITAAASLVAPHGTLLAIGRLAGDIEERVHMPWPLTRVELDSFTRAGLYQAHFVAYLDDEENPVNRFRAEYRR
jgi:SAM-dependent methyltransferase